jgi:hypothetical protein
VLSYILDADSSKRFVLSRVDNWLGLDHHEAYVADRDRSIPLEKRVVPSVSQWLSCFADAEFVVTDSFHGCVLSILFHKPFIALANIGRGISRVQSLLESLGLDDRIVQGIDPEDDGEYYLSAIDWEKVDERYFKYQEDTSAFWHNVTQKYKSYQWFISENSSTSYSYAPPMQPANGSLSGFSGIKAYGRTADYSYTIRYLEEDTDREIKEAFTGKTSKWSIMFTNEDHIIIPGFTFSKESAFDRNRVGTLYYERNTYTLKLFANGGPAPEGGSEYRGIKFEASLAGYSPSNYKAGVTTAVFDGVTKTFAGWYDNQLLDGSPSSFN